MVVLVLRDYTLCCVFAVRISRLVYDPKHMTTAAQTPAQGHEITLVTAYFQLDNAARGRSPRDYSAWMAQLLPFIRWPMVIYCDAQSVEQVKRLRGGKPAVYCVTSLEEFAGYRYRDIIRA